MKTAGVGLVRGLNCFEKLKKFEEAAKELLQSFQGRKKQQESEMLFGLEDYMTSWDPEKEGPTPCVPKSGKMTQNATQTENLENDFIERLTKNKGT